MTNQDQETVIYEGEPTDPVEGCPQRKYPHDHVLCRTAVTAQDQNEPVMDWEQVRLNGGPPCYALLGETLNGRPRYCGRAERWEGHGSDHAFVAGASPSPTPSDRPIAFMRWLERRNPDVYRARHVDHASAFTEGEAFALEAWNAAWFAARIASPDVNALAQTIITEINSAIFGVTGAGVSVLARIDVRGIVTKHLTAASLSPKDGE